MYRKIIVILLKTYLYFVSFLKLKRRNTSDKLFYIFGLSQIFNSQINYNNIKFLHQAEVKIFSQNGEDGIIDYIISRLGILIPNFIEILPRANLQFTIDPPVTTLSDPLVTFTGLTNNASAESWEIEGFGTFNEDQVEILFEDTGAYVVTYSAITAEGCEASKRDTVLIFDEFALYIPGAFSPNEDGLNDVFIPVASGFEAEDYEFQVFNRWGQRIFFTNQLGEGWTGNDVKQDVYIWTITGKSRINTETVEYKGSVTLIN
jgi:gliding motility-associated-like protein